MILMAGNPFIRQVLIDDQGGIIITDKKPKRKTVFNDDGNRDIQEINNPGRRFPANRVPDVEKQQARPNPKQQRLRL